jgi:Protein of unknown function (DUF3365)
MKLWVCKNDDAEMLTKLGSQKLVLLQERVMNKRVLAAFLLPCVLSAGVVSAETEKVADKVLAAEGKKLMMQFAGELKSSLKAAIKEGGFPQGVEACALKAPEIASANSQGQWTVARTSLKPRNPDNTPSAEQEKVLQGFEQALKEGQPIAKMMAISKDEKAFHMMKAIPTQGLCLSCHGQDLSAEVDSILQEKYPEDKATGYQEGDIRGAFSLVYRYQ